MQRAFDSAVGLRRRVSIHVVATIGSEMNPTLLTGMETLPLVLDSTTANVQRDWAASTRDVVVLDETGTRRLVFNLTANNLGEMANYAALESALRRLAE